MAHMRHSGVIKSPPVWAKDFGGREHIVPFPIKLDPTQFHRPDSVLVTVAAGGAAQGAVAIPVTALPGPVPAGTILDFGGAGLFALVTALALTGATSLTVEALPQAIAAGNTARYRGVKPLSIPSGTYVGRTLAERATNPPTPFGPAVAADAERYLLVFDVPDAELVAEGEGYRHNSLVAENYLPGWATLAGDIQAAIRADYTCIVGVD